MKEGRHSSKISGSRALASTAAEKADVVMGTAAVRSCMADNAGKNGPLTQVSVIGRP
jgi:hypothetical protein